MEHFIGQEHFLEQRYDIYFSKLNLLDYEIDIDKIRRTIICQKKRTPADNGGGSSF